MDEKVIKCEKNSIDEISIEELKALYKRNKRLFQLLTKLNAENLSEVERYSEYRVKTQERIEI